MGVPSDVETRAVLIEALTEARAFDALGEALRVAGISQPPGAPAEMLGFMEGPLRSVLDEIREGEEVEQLIGRIRDDLAGLTRMHSDLPPQHMAPTVPPPAIAPGGGAYSDLVSGAVHDRVTPTWGLRRVEPGAAPATMVWAIVSNHGPLVQGAMVGAPAGVDVVPASSLAILAGAIARAPEGRLTVVIDALEPSVPVDRVIDRLGPEVVGLRVIVWRMTRDARARLLEAAPHAHGWLPCTDEVTPPEIVQLLGV